MFVKICGITNEEDALLAVAMGADAVGFIFAPSSRQIAVTLARDIARRLPPEILTVGVFRDEAPQRVVEIVNTAGLPRRSSTATRRPAEAEWIRERVPFVIQAFSAGDRMLDRVAEYTAPTPSCIDSPPAAARARCSTGRWPSGLPLDRRVILAGGLTPDNVADAIHRVHPWGVDVATGVEAATRARRTARRSGASSTRPTRPPTRTIPRASPTPSSTTVDLVAPERRYDYDDEVSPA